MTYFLKLVIGHQQLSFVSENSCLLLKFWHIPVSIFPFSLLLHLLQCTYFGFVDIQSSLHTCSSSSILRNHQSRCLERRRRQPTNMNPSIADSSLWKNSQWLEGRVRGLFYLFSSIKQNSCTLCKVITSKIGHFCFLLVTLSLEEIKT